MLENGAIVIDEYMHTSEKDVFAAGDSCAVIYNPTQVPTFPWPPTPLEWVQ